MRALLFERFGKPDVLRVVDRPRPAGGDGVALIAVEAAGINPSDVKNVAGRMSQTVPPRVPGRDFAGTVVEGPPEWRGAAVWGTGGDVGFTRDGSHAEMIAVPVASLRRRPARLSAVEAGSIGVTFVTAWHAIIAEAGLRAGETLAVIGAGGGVGSAAVQIGRRAGATVIGLTRRAPAVDSPLRAIADHVVATETPDFPAAVRDVSGGGADVVLDCVGGTIVSSALRCLRRRGRMVAITIGDSAEARFDMAAFYHNESRLIGVDTLSLGVEACAPILEQIGAGFDDGAFVAPPVARTFALDESRAAYEAVLASPGGRVVLTPGGGAAAM